MDIKKIDGKFYVEYESLWTYMHAVEVYHRSVARQFDDNSEYYKHIGAMGDCESFKVCLEQLKNEIKEF